MRSRSWASAVAAPLLLVALALSSCGDDGSGPGEDAQLTVYVSLPLSGPARADGTDAADGARLALADATAAIGGYAIATEFLDAGAAPLGWSPARAAANARTATRDSTAIAYIGDFESGATRASLPITNGARLMQISPAAGAFDLVAESADSDDVPALQHSGSRSFARVIPADAAQARAGAGWAAEQGVRRACVEAGSSQFGREMVAAFRRQAGEEGIAVEPTGGRCAGELLYSPAVEAGDRVASDPGRDPLMLSDAAIAANGRAVLGGPAEITSAALDPAQLPPAGAEFVERFVDEYGRSPGRYAAYGYEALALALDVIGRAADPADRTAVVESLFETTGRDSILGEYSITEVGDTTLDRMTGFRARRGGELEPAIELTVP